MSAATPVQGGTLLERLAARARAHGGQPACLQKRHGVWHTWTWQALLARVERWARGLQEAGLQPGSAVAIVSGARVEAVVAQWACLRAGLVPVPLNPNLPPGGVATQALEASAVAFILEDQEQVDKVADQLSRLPALQGVWVVDAKGTRGYRHIALRATQQWDESAGHEAAPPRPARMRLLTTGAVSEARQVEVDLDALERLEGLGAEMGFSEGARCASLFGPWCPMGHFVGMLAPVLYGSVSCFGEGRLPTVAEWRECAPQVVALPARALDRLRAESVARAQRSRGWRRRVFEAWQARAGRSGAWHALVGEPVARGLGLSACRRVLTTFEPVSPASEGFLAALRLASRGLYVLAECAGPLGHFEPAEPGVLRLWPGVHAELDSAGQLQVQVGDTRLHTGDRADPHPAGFVHAGRAADQLRLADGQWLSPVTVESQLLACPYVQQVVVVGGPASGLVALVELDEAMLREWARSQGLVFTTTRSIAQSAAVVALIEAAVREANERLPPAARIVRTVLLPRPLDPANGELSPSLAVRRAIVRNRYAHRLVTGEHA